MRLLDRERKVKGNKDTKRIDPFGPPFERLPFFLPHLSAQLTDSPLSTAAPHPPAPRNLATNRAHRSISGRLLNVSASSDDLLPFDLLGFSLGRSFLSFFLFLIPPRWDYSNARKFSTRVAPSFPLVGLFRGGGGERKKEFWPKYGRARVSTPVDSILLGHAPPST